MITEAGWIIIIEMVVGCIVTVVTILNRRDVISLKPHVQSTAELLKEANALILKQGNIITAQGDELAMRKPTMTEKRFDADFQASPPYRKPDK